MASDRLFAVADRVSLKRRCHRLQQQRDRTTITRVGDQTIQADPTGLDIYEFILGKHGIASGEIERTGLGAAVEHEEPSLPHRVETPGRVGPQSDSLEYEVVVRNQ